MGRLRRLHPFLFVVIPVLNVMVRNPGAATLRDLLALAFAMLGAATLDVTPANVISATGARRAVVLGSVTPKP